MVDLDIKDKVMKLLEENNGLCLRRVFIREIICEFHCIKFKNIHS